MTEKNNQYRFDSVDLLFYLWNKRLPLMIITGIAAIASIIVSFVIEEKYKSEVVLFPAAAGSVSQDLLSDSYSEKSILKLGEDEELEQLMQVLHSDQIRERVVKKFDLMRHYDIDSTSKYPYTALFKKYEQNIRIEPTKFLSVKITVLDEKPQIAADIANTISDLVDTVMNNMQRQKAMQALALVEKEYFALKNDVNKLEDSLDYIRSLGVIDYETQTEVFSDALGQALVKNNSEAVKKLQEKLDLLGKVGGPYLAINGYLEFENKQLSALKAKYAEAQIDAYQNLSKKYVVNQAFKAEKKSYPVRWLIVLLSTVSAFILTLLLLVIYDSVNRRLNELKLQNK
jgi:capsular polysaccharide biosynthesis protein